MPREQLFAIDETWTVRETRYYRAKSEKEARSMAGSGNYVGIGSMSFEDFRDIDTIGVLTPTEEKDLFQGFAANQRRFKL